MQFISQSVKRASRRGELCLKSPGRRLSVLESLASFQVVCLNCGGLADVCGLEPLQFRLTFGINLHNVPLSLVCSLLEVLHLALKGLALL